jgi:hypothetical protein
VACQITELSGIDCTCLLDENPGELTLYFYLRPKRCRPGDDGCRRNQDYRSWEKLIRLNNDRISCPVARARVCEAA